MLLRYNIIDILTRLKTGNRNFVPEGKIWNDVCYAELKAHSYEIIHGHFLGNFLWNFARIQEFIVKWYFVWHLIRNFMCTFVLNYSLNSMTKFHTKFYMKLHMKLRNFMWNFHTKFFMGNFPYEVLLIPINEWFHVQFQIKFQKKFNITYLAMNRKFHWKNRPI